MYICTNLRYQSVACHRHLGRSVTASCARGGGREAGNRTNRASKASYYYFNYLLSFGRFAFPRKEVTKTSGVGGSCICGSTISPLVSKGQKLFLNKL